MDSFIAERNIDHYRKLLATDLDAERRKTVEMLLTEEEEKLEKSAWTARPSRFSKQR